MRERCGYIVKENESQGQIRESERGRKRLKDGERDERGGGQERNGERMREIVKEKDRQRQKRQSERD